MKFYSEITKELYDSEKECAKAEKLHEDKRLKEQAEKAKLAEERKAAAEKVEAARKAASAAKEAYYEELTAFCEKYGAYHTTIRPSDSFNSIFKMLFN